MENLQKSYSFISERIHPDKSTFSPSRMAQGAPGLPGRFTWRSREYEVSRVEKTWVSTSQCRHGADEQYVRRHWFDAVMVTGEHMRIYFDRQPKPGQITKRWWLAGIRREETNGR